MHSCALVWHESLSLDPGSFMFPDENRPFPNMNTTMPAPNHPLFEQVMPVRDLQDTLHEPATAYGG